MKRGLALNEGAMSVNREVVPDLDELYGSNKTNHDTRTSHLLALYVGPCLLPGLLLDLLKRVKSGR